MYRLNDELESYLVGVYEAIHDFEKVEVCSQLLQAVKTAKPEAELVFIRSDEKDREKFPYPHFWLFCNPKHPFIFGSDFMVDRIINNVGE
jgi:hypothetical protein